MNKRQIKKMNTVKNKETNAVVKVDLTNVTDNSHIDIYVSNDFKVTRDYEHYLGNENHDGKVSTTKAIARGKDCLIYIVNGKDKKISVSAFLSDTNKSYYVIRPKQTTEKG
ncbi:hypothetical protein [Priestia flexa]|uniref:hypothetical protein n=1 Tax=Priestia flexa TaxID=86664 RepID=UPI00047352B1|nr:hypothetical protein [Priestia flexa]